MTSPAHDPDGIQMLRQNASCEACRCPQKHKNNREPQNKRERMKQRYIHVPSARLAAHELIITYAGYVGDIGRNQRKNARRSEGNQPHKERKERNRERQSV